MRVVTPSRRRGILFNAIAVLVLLQVTWWTVVFLGDVERIRQLRLAIQGAAQGEIESEAFHRRFMFISESLTFAILSCIGLYLLARALKTEARALASERKLLEILSHETKTPLTALKLRLESIREKHPALERELGLSLNEVQRLSSTLEKALSLNRMERRAFRFEPVNLVDVVNEVLRRLEPLLKSRRVNVVTRLDTEALVNGEPYGLQSSFQTLIENAILYNQSDAKEVAVEMKRQGSRVRVRISDNGPGISEGERDKIFERLYRGESARGIPGTGLGLTIARSIVEAHHGVLSLMSTVGPGSHFEMELPLWQPS